MSQQIRTTILILSDTHGESIDLANMPPVDLAIHCGDLTEESNLSEFRTSIDLLSKIPATTKLVIAGNHDFTLDIAAFQRIVADNELLDRKQVIQTFGDYGEAEEMLIQARDAGIIFLHEGTHTTHLKNGATLKIYASPFTSSKSNWGFVYSPEEDHAWGIEANTDIVITHSPPRGILDYTDSKQRAGSASLFAAVAKARPKLHCFGHIHEAWGAKLVQWRDGDDPIPSHFSSIDNDNSRTIETLATLRAGRYDMPDMAAEKKRRNHRYQSQGYCSTSDSPKWRAQTLFVNAAIESAGDDPEQRQLPWIVEIDLLSKYD